MEPPCHKWWLGVVNTGQSITKIKVVEHVEAVSFIEPLVTVNKLEHNNSKMDENTNKDLIPGPQDGKLSPNTK